MDASRLPLATYEQGIWRLAKWHTTEGYTSEQLDLAVQVVADVFWLSDAKVRHDMQKAVRSLDHAVAPYPARRRRVSRYAEAF